MPLSSPLLWPSTRRLSLTDHRRICRDSKIEQRLIYWSLFTPSTAPKSSPSTSARPHKARHTTPPAALHFVVDTTTESLRTSAAPSTLLHTLSTIGVLLHLPVLCLRACSATSVPTVTSNCRTLCSSYPYSFPSLSVPTSSVESSRSLASQKPLI
ncbi:hypothetical protein GW17_00058437 [Ensete ventricosum]|nr:hypothetical protein GW17_00058437 [Ensete ventricosum]